MHITRKTSTIIAAIAIILVITTVTALLTSPYLISTSGTFKKSLNLEIYVDSGGAQPISAIGWGDMEPGDFSNITVYCEVTGNTPATLSFVTGNHLPTNSSQYLILTWDDDGSVLQPGVIRPVIFSLSLSQTVIGITAFSFDITVQATEV